MNDEIDEYEDFTCEDGSPVPKPQMNSVQITEVKEIKPEFPAFNVPEEKPLSTIEKPDIEEPQVHLTTGDIIPAIPNILVKVLTMKTDLKSTLIGMGGCVLVAIGDYIRSGGTMTVEGVLSAAAFAVFGFWAADPKKK